MKYASVYCRAGKVFLRSEDKTIAGTHISQDNTVALDATDLESLGVALRVALEASREDVPIPSRERMSLDAPSSLYPAAGVSNWREFAKGAKSISVDLAEERIRLAPWKNEGARATFVPLKGRDRFVPESSPDIELGAAVIAALADAE